jgi:hypothetical protein
MSMNKVKLSQIINDFIIIVGDDGMVHVLNNNKNINYSRRITQVDTDADGVVDSDTTSTDNSDEGPLNIDSNLILDREPSKSSTTGATTSSEDADFYLFENYLHQGGLGRLYGVGGGYAAGEYRLNLDQNRIEIKMDDSASEVVLEYIADEARSTDPEVHVYAEEALRCYIYYKAVERKSSVPANEKARARSEFYNERRKANARLSNFTKEEALSTIRRNFKQAPKY